MEKIIFVTAIISSIFLSCSSTQSRNENWEGFSKDIMRIVISEYFPPDETDEQKIPQQLINERFEQRATLMLVSYVNLRIPRNAVSSQNDTLFNRLISDAIAGVKIIRTSCDENNLCFVITEYNISAINRELEKLNKK